jgi:hypothetical protein
VALPVVAAHAARLAAAPIMLLPVSVARRVGKATAQNGWIVSVYVVKKESFVLNISLPSTSSSAASKDRQ